MKKILLAISLLISILGHAQVREHNDSTINVVLNNQLNLLQSKLYKAAIAGKIRGFKNDSLNSYYSLEEAKFLNSYQKTVKVKKGTRLLYSPSDSLNRRLFKNMDDSTGMRILLEFYDVKNNRRFIPDTNKSNCYLLDTNYQGGVPRFYIDNNYKDTTVPKFHDPESLQGITAYYVQKNDFKYRSRNYDLDFISIDYRPIAGSTGIELPISPMFYFKWKDIQNVLTRKELDYLIIFSNILLGDEIYSSWMNLNEEVFYTFKFWNINRKWSKIFKTSLTEASKAIFYECQKTITGSVFTKYPVYLDDKLTQPLDSMAYYSAMYYSKTIQVYPDPNDPYYSIDSVVLVPHSEGDYSKIIFKDNVVGLVLNQTEYPGKYPAIYIKRSDFYKISPPWVAYILKEYF